MGGGEALAVSEDKHPLGVRTLRTRHSRVSAAAVSPRPEGCPQLLGQEARCLSPSFLLALQSCPAAFGRGLPPTRRHPARRAEPGKGIPAGVPASWRIGSGAKREVLEAAIESGLLISGGTSNRFHASGVSCQ